MYKIKKQVTVEKELEVKPCYQCGLTDVETFKSRGCFSSFNVCGVTCKNCKRKVSKMGDYSEEELIEYWNSVNGVLTDNQRLDILRKQLTDLGKEPIV